MLSQPVYSLSGLQGLEWLWWWGAGGTGGGGRRRNNSAIFCLMTSRLSRVASLSRCQSVYRTVKQSLYHMDLGFWMISVSGQLEHETHFYQLYVKVSSWVEAKKKKTTWKTNLNLTNVTTSEYFLILLMNHIKIKKKQAVKYPDVCQKCWLITLLIDYRGSEIVRYHVYSGHSKSLSYKVRISHKNSFLEGELKAEGWN